MSPLVAAEVFVLIMALVLFSARALGWHEQRVENALGRLSLGVHDAAQLTFLRKRRPSDGKLYETVLHRMHLTRALERSMWQAGLYMRVSEMLLLIGLLFGTGAAAGGVLWGQSILTLGSGAALAALPILFIRWRKQRRLRLFGEQLPYALDLIKSLLEAGHSLLRALQVVVKEFRDPIAAEFATVLEQASLGLPVSRALDEMLKRVPEDDLRLLVVAVKVQSEVGSSLAQIIGRLSEVIRTRQRLHDQVRALTAQSRMSGIVVGLLPAVVLGAFSLVQPGYANALFHDPMGLKMLKIAAGLDLMAIFTIRRLLRVKF